ncbi:Os11g0201000, partial [Oryza sativa Japonica Group]
LLADGDRRLVAPRGCDVVDGVAAAADEEQRQVEPAEEADALRVAPHRQLHAAEAVAGERVGAALQHDGLRLEHLHGLAHDRLEQRVVHVGADAGVQGHVHAVVLAGAGADFVDGAGAREEVLVGRDFAVPVERQRHDPVGVQEGVLHAVAVVRVDVDVDDSPEGAEELVDGEHDVVDVAEAGGLAGGRVVHAA